MTLEQYAYLAEIVGVVLIIVSLVYVAQQLRQNAVAMRTGNQNNLVHVQMGLSAPFITDPTLTDLWMKAGTQFDDLNPIDQQRMILHEWQAITGWYNYFNQRKQQLVSDEQWTVMIWIFENMGRRQSVRAAWKTLKTGYSKEFQEFLDPYIEARA